MSLDAVFHRIQRRFMVQAHGSEPRGVSGEQAVPRSFSPEVLTGLVPKSEIERLVDYERKKFALRVAKADQTRMENCVSRVRERIEQSKAEAA
ncbi:hypothetical protein RE428_32230 [Marinobacter nanhaiticus D15-8W]|uniref:Uncharacterized protein n=1 Tax=Marinobacter nanhaiticus D15-8W TaxID=626887 RepID=N6W2Z4_9GAMM|nr:hypothetical protein J057_01885 [Marinobacter nanhaiticus D15-8W]BES72205.1 hypothetical protein RE428_32230 [Marinobacter nanhaiticus D15-8W]